MAKRTVKKSAVSSRRPNTSASDSSPKHRSSSTSFSSGEDMDQVESIRQVSGQKSNTASNSSSGGKNMWKELMANPAVRYVAGGIATAILSKVASNLTAKYPEISRFINENLDGVEGRLAEFKSGLNSNSEVSRH